MSTLSTRLAHRRPQPKRRMAPMLLALAVLVVAATLVVSVPAPGLADICAQDGLLVCGP